MMNELMYILLSPLLTEMLRGQVNILSAAIVPSIQKKKTLSALEIKWHRL